MYVLYLSREAYLGGPCRAPPASPSLTNVATTTFDIVLYLVASTGPSMGSGAVG
jgi:hypothetical protein